MGAAAGSELLISEPKTRVRPKAAASAHWAHPVSSSRDQQPETGSSPHLNQSIHVKSTVQLYGLYYSCHSEPAQATVSDIRRTTVVA
jgi:hypothetical protein